MNARISSDQRLVTLILERLTDLARWDDSDPPLPAAALVAIILSQNTSDVNSARAFAQLRQTYPTWDEVADADAGELADAIRSGGLAAQKSRTIIDALQTLRARHRGLDLERFADGSDEELLAELVALKGVGLKTAACVLMFSLGRDLCAIDTHIHRVANRLGLVSTSSPDRTFHDLRPQIPAGRARDLHVGLIRFGRHICKSQRPHCFECPLFDICGWEMKKEFARAGLRGARAVSGDTVLPDILRDIKRRGDSERSQ